jgi:hypothetical protein
MSIEAMKQALEALELLVEERSSEAMDDGDVAITSLRQAIAEAEKQEPDKYVMDIECTKCGAQQSGILTVNTTPQQRKPLTDEQFQAIRNSLYRQDGWDGDGWDLALKEAIEAAHGIKE